MEQFLINPTTRESEQWLLLKRYSDLLGSDIRDHFEVMEVFSFDTCVCYTSVYLYQNILTHTLRICVFHCM